MLPNTAAAQKLCKPTTIIYNTLKLIDTVKQPINLRHSIVLEIRYYLFLFSGSILFRSQFQKTVALRSVYSPSYAKVVRHNQLARQTIQQLHRP